MVKALPTPAFYIPCDGCGKMFRMTVSRYKLSKRHFCCRECYRQAQMTGNKHVKKTDRTTDLFGHRKGKNTRKYCVYTVYNNRTDEVVIVDGTAEQAAKAMGISINSFYGYVKRVREGEINKWWIERSFLDGKKLCA